MYYLYILHTSRNTLYTGITTNIWRRLKQHYKKSPQSAKYMRSCNSFALVHLEKVSSKSLALKREIAIKRLNRRKKFQLIRG